MLSPGTLESQSGEIETRTAHQIRVFECCRLRYSADHECVGHGPLCLGPEPRPHCSGPRTALGFLEAPNLGKGEPGKLLKELPHRVDADPK